MSGRERDQDVVLACLLAVDLQEQPASVPTLLTPEQARAHARDRAAVAKPRRPSSPALPAHTHDPLARPDGTPCKGKLAAQALAAIVRHLQDNGCAGGVPWDLLQRAEAALQPFDVARLLGGA